MHIDKETQYSINGKRSKIRIKIPINSDRPIKITAKSGNVENIPQKLKKEILKAFENKQIREAFLSDLLDVLKNYDDFTVTEDTAKQVLSRISKHFGLDLPTKTIAVYVNDILDKYKLEYEINNEKYFAEARKDNMRFGQYKIRKNASL